MNIPQGLKNIAPAYSRGRWWGLSKARRAYMGLWWLNVFFPLCIILLHNAAFAQTDDSTSSTPFVSLHGSISLSTDLYNSTSTPDSAQPSRRPAVLHRLLINAALGFGDLISIPLTLLLTAPEVSTTTSALPNPTLAQFLENPANVLGLSCLSTKIGWAEVHLGSHTPNFSPLSGGDVQLFGAGVDLKPGMFRFAASAGTSQRSIEPDEANGVRGAYRRDLMIGRIAFGKEDETSLGINVVSVKDAVSSLHNNIVSITPAHQLTEDTTIIVPADTMRLQAQEGLVATTNVNVMFGEGMSLNAEIAASSFTNDQSSPEKAIAGNPLSAVMTTRTSTRTDVAGSAALTLQKEVWGIALNGLYIGAGFTPIGYAFMQSDRFEYTVAPSLRLFENKLSLGGSLGQRVNNLSDTKGETTTQVIGSAQMSATISDAFNLSAKYSNFGIHNNQVLDTLRVQNVTESFSIDPTLTIQQTDIMHVFVASFAMDAYKDYNVVSGAEANNDTRTLMASYSATLVPIPLTINALASYMENRLSAGTLKIRSIGATIGYAFFDRAIVPSLSVTASGSTMGGAPTDAQIFYKLGVHWQIMSKLEFTANIGNNRFTYGDPIPKGSAFRETVVELALAAQF